MGCFACKPMPSWLADCEMVGKCARRLCAPAHIRPLFNPWCACAQTPIPRCMHDAASARHQAPIHPESHCFGSDTHHETHQHPHCTMENILLWPVCRHFAGRPGCFTGTSDSLQKTTTCCIYPAAIGKGAGRFSDRACDDDTGSGEPSCDRILAGMVKHAQIRGSTPRASGAECLVPSARWGQRSA